MTLPELATWVYERPMMTANYRPTAASPTCPVVPLGNLSLSQQEAAIVQDLLLVMTVSRLTTGLKQLVLHVQLYPWVI